LWGFIFKLNIAAIDGFLNEEVTLWGVVHSKFYSICCLII
jgi:hypothetical protein